MIFELIFNVLFGFFRFVLDLLPSIPAPSWVGNIGGALATVWSHAAGLGAWFPWSVIATVLGTVLACMVLGVAIRFARMVLSLFTGGGGAAS